MHVQSWRLRRRPRPAMAAVGLAAALALVTTACSSTSSNASSTGGTKVEGGTATWALQPSVVPNYIFPFVSGTYASTVTSKNSST